MAISRDIRTNQLDLSCDVCGRTLLRGERAESFIAGGARRQVCDLCIVRAQHEGWIREADALETGIGSRYDGHRGWRDRWRERRERAAERREAARAADDRRSEFEQREADRAAGDRATAERDAAERDVLDQADRLATARAAAAHGPLDLDPDGSPEGRAAAERAIVARMAAERPAPAPAPAPAAPEPAEPDEAPRRLLRKPRRPETGPREPRHVRAVPTNLEIKMQRALDVFNASDFVRTVGGVSRSLGAPDVCVRAVPARPSVVLITVMWELSWYRFEVDLSDETPGVRRDAQGAELAELDEAERRANAGADERGALHLSTAAR